jgi:predicted DCC family thiol-disulfide oxidoreductase YuxK
VLPKPVRDFLYARIANNRYRLFGRTRECFLPDPETRRRFVLPGDPFPS